VAARAQRRNAPHSAAPMPQDAATRRNSGCHKPPHCRSVLRHCGMRRWPMAAAWASVLGASKIQSFSAGRESADHFSHQNLIFFARKKFQGRDQILDPR